MYRKSFGAVIAAMIAAIVAAAMSVAGCDGDRSSGGKVLESDGVRALVAGPKNFGRDALIVGNLALTDGRCLAVRSAEGRTHLLVWPSGVSLLADGRVGVDVPGLGAITVGESFSAGGGYATPPLHQEERAPEVPTDCSAPAEEGVAIIDQANTISK